MPIAFRTFPAANVVALFDEPVSTGAVHDINAPRNAPALAPQEHLDKVYFHSSLDNLEVADSITLEVEHAAIPSGTLGTGMAVVFGWKAASADHLLLAHDLGYVPYAMVVQGDNVLWPGMPVQVGAAGAARYASAYCTEDGVYLYEWGSIGSVSMDAVSLDYTVLLFRDPPAPSGDKLFEFEPATGVVTMARGRFDSSRRYLQVTPGGSPFGISYGRTIDLANGAMRAVRADGTAVDPVPDTLKMGVSSPDRGISYGLPMNYTGSYVAPASISVQAP